MFAFVHEASLPLSASLPAVNCVTADDPACFCIDTQNEFLWLFLSWVYKA